MMAAQWMDRSRRGKNRKAIIANRFCASVELQFKIVNDPCLLNVISYTVILYKNACLLQSQWWTVRFIFLESGLETWVVGPFNKKNWLAFSNNHF